MGDHVEWPEEVSHLLLLQWVYALAANEIGVTGFGSSGDISPTARVPRTWTFQLSETAGFRLARTVDDAMWRVEADDGVDLAAVENIVSRAEAAVNRQDLGDDVRFDFKLETHDPNIRDFSGIHFLRHLGDQVLITGDRRLSGRVLLRFECELPAGQDVLFLPKTEIAVTMYAPGPAIPGGVTGPLTKRVVASMYETVRLVCVFALGHPIEGHVVAPMFAAKDARPDLDAKRTDPNILTLARDHVSLDVLDGLALIGGVESVRKVQSSLVAYDAAITQTNPDVATILFVTGIEALVNPDTEWRRDRAVARFIKSVRELCPQTVSELANHPNIVDALGFELSGGPSTRQRRFLDAVYALRSSPAHGGLFMAAPSFEHPPGMGLPRMSILSKLHRKALLAYLEAPRSFLTGHPQLWPSPPRGESV